MILASWLMCAILWTISGNQWFVVLLTGGLGTLTLIVIAYYVFVQRQAISMLRRFDPPEEILSFDDEGISIKSSLGETSIRWNAILEICRFQEIWLLCAGKEVLVTLPIEQVSQEITGGNYRNYSNEWRQGFLDGIDFHVSCQYSVGGRVCCDDRRFGDLAVTC